MNDAIAPHCAFITGSDVLMDGGVTATFRPDGPGSPQPAT